MVALLLDRGADVASKDDVGCTPLFIAIFNHFTDIAELLLQKGADPNQKTSTGSVLQAVVFKDVLETTPLQIAVQQGCTGIVEVLLKRYKVPVNTRNGEGFTPLHDAALNGKSEIVRLLIEHGADVNAMSEYNTPLLIAATYGQIAVAELLIKSKADVNTRDSSGRTALTLAIQPPGNYDRGGRELVKLLLDNGAQDDRALHTAVGTGRQDLVDLILQYRPDINVRDQYGRTALHLAVGDENIDMVQLLLEKGADVNAKDSQGHTPLYDTWGGSGHERRIKELLRKHGGV
jgi:ankyrin repeat protein